MDDKNSWFGQFITNGEGYDLGSFEVKQNKSLWLTERAAITSMAQASRFLRSVGIALRAWATKGIPLASMYQACTGNNR